MIIWHRHHLIPTHDGGTDDPNNLVRCNVAMHAFLHEQRFKELGQWQDEFAYKALRGLIPTAEVAHQLNKHAKKFKNPQERIRKIIATQKGRPLSKKHRESISKGKLGKPRSEAIKKKISETMKGVKKKGKQLLKGTNRTSKQIALDRRKAKWMKGKRIGEQWVVKD